MNGPEIISSVAADLERQLQQHRQQPLASIPTTLSPALAVALLQKSIRRGRTDLALVAANTLLRVAPERLWRRLAVIAVEDIGLGDLDAVYVTIVASAHWRRLARRFGDELLVNFVVSRLASVPKCRSSDDLYVVTAVWPAWDQANLELADLRLGDLLGVVVGDGPIERRAIALRLAIADATLTGVTRRGQPRTDAVFDFLCEAGFPHTLVEISRTAYRQTREVIAAFIPLLHQQFDSRTAEIRSDLLPSETIAGGIPGWTYDKFSREGRTALNRLLRVDCATTNWLRFHVAPGDRLTVLGHAVFRVESGLVADRLIWPTGDCLRRQADLDTWSFDRLDATTLLGHVRTDIDILNRVRGQAHGA